MPVIVPALLRLPFVGAVVAIFLIWSFYYIDLPTVTSVGSTTYEEIVESQTVGVDAAARLALGADLPAHRDSSTTSTTPQAIPSVVAIQVPEELSGDGDQISNITQSISERPLILYAYSESKTARPNIEYFIRHGLHAAADFLFILNGGTNIARSIPKESNIRVIQRRNDCYDLGAYAEILTKDDLYKGYKRFIMLNASIRGPFFPSWAKGCWSDIYLGRLTDEVKLVGMTANCWPLFHIQSMIWATDIHGLKALLFPTKAAIAAYKIPFNSTEKDPEKRAKEHKQKPGINDCFHTWFSAVTAEVGASSLIKAAGYKLDVMMSAFHGTDRFEEVCDNTANADVLWDKKYFGTNVHPFETVFMKSNRDIDPIGIERHTDWMRGSGFSSYEYCQTTTSPWIAGESI